MSTAASQVKAVTAVALDGAADFRACEPAYFFSRHAATCLPPTLLYHTRARRLAAAPSPPRSLPPHARSRRELRAQAKPRDVRAQGWLCLGTSVGRAGAKGAH